MKFIPFLLSLLLGIGCFGQSLPNIWVPTSGTDTYTTFITSFGSGSYANKIAYVKFGNTNTGASTLQINGIASPPALRMFDGDSWEPLTAGQIDVNTVYKVAYNGNYWQMESFGTGGGGGGTWGSITGTLSDQTDLQSALDGKQALDSDLTAISGLSSTGVIARTGSGTAAVRTITGTANQITITNGSGASGDPTIAFASSPILPSTTTATTQSINTNSTTVATTAYVDRTAVTSTSASTASSTITLDLNSQVQRIFLGSASFSTPKTIAFSNATNGLSMSFVFTVTDVAAELTMPANVVMSDINFDGTTWTPPDTGQFLMGATYNGTNWMTIIAGPFN